MVLASAVVQKGRWRRYVTSPKRFVRSIERYMCVDSYVSIYIYVCMYQSSCIEIYTCIAWKYVYRRNEGQPTACSNQETMGTSLREPASDPCNPVGIPCMIGWLHAV